MDYLIVRSLEGKLCFIDRLYLYDVIVVNQPFNEYKTKSFYTKPKVPRFCDTWIPAPKNCILFVEEVQYLSTWFQL